MFAWPFLFVLFCCGLFQQYIFAFLLSVFSSFLLLTLQEFSRLDPALQLTVPPPPSPAPSSSSAVRYDNHNAHVKGALPSSSSSSSSLHHPRLPSRDHQPSPPATLLTDANGQIANGQIANGQLSTSGQLANGYPRPLPPTASSASSIVEDEETTTKSKENCGFVGEAGGGNDDEEGKGGDSGGRKEEKKVATAAAEVVPTNACAACGSPAKSRCCPCFKVWKPGTCVCGGVMWRGAAAFFYICDGSS